MSIESIGSGTGSVAQQVRQAASLAGAQTGVQQAVLSAAATTMGITLSELRAELAKGESLSSIAAAHNVSVATLQSMMASAATTANPSVSGDQAQQLVQRIVTSAESAATGKGTSSSESGL